MEISASSFNAGIAAMQAGQQQASRASQAIASAPTADMASLSEQLVKLEMARQQVEAGSKVVATNDQVLGSLIDTHA